MSHLGQNCVNGDFLSQAPSDEVSYSTLLQISILIRLKFKNIYLLIAHNLMREWVELGVGEGTLIPIVLGNFEVNLILKKIRTD